MVYVIGDASGKTSDIIVSEHLKNAAVGNKVEDVSELSDIENVKGEGNLLKGSRQYAYMADGGQRYLLSGQV